MFPHQILLKSQYTREENTGQRRGRLTLRRQIRSSINGNQIKRLHSSPLHLFCLLTPRSRQIHKRPFVPIPPPPLLRAPPHLFHRRDPTGSFLAKGSRQAEDLFSGGNLVLVRPILWAGNFGFAFPADVDAVFGVIEDVPYFRAAFVWV